MKNQKSQGSDGLTAEFHKIFWINIKNILCKIDKLLVQERLFNGT